MTEKELIDKVRKVGGKIYIVGGYLRDELLDITPHDKDYLVTGITEQIFSNPIGKDFPVFLEEIDGEKCEIAYARKERSTGDKHTDFQCICDASITVEEDLFRRDFTMNAMAFDLMNERLIDPFGGFDDIKNKIIRHVSDSFREDPLRVLRMARFSARFFDFTLSGETWDICRTIDISQLSPERVMKEMFKALETEHPSRFFDALIRTHQISVWFPEVYSLCVTDMHDGTAYHHTMKIMDSCHNVYHRFGALCHDFGKGLTPYKEHPHHYGHDQLGVSAVEDFCKRLKVPNKYRDFGKDCSLYHMKVKNLEGRKKGKLFKMLQLKNIKDVAYISCMDSIYRENGNKQEAILSFINFLYLYDNMEKTCKNITGKDLIDEGFEPSEKFGETLFQRRVHYFIGLCRSIHYDVKMFDNKFIIEYEDYYGESYEV